MDRVAAIDIVKAVAISLLVLGHVIEGLNQMKVIADTSFLLALQDWLRSLRMPAFFFAAGAVLSLRPLRTPAYFLHHRFATLAYPHLLWGIVYLAIAILFARYYNSPIQDPGDLGRHLIETVTGQRSWFLASLFLVSIIAYFLFRLDPYLGVAVGLLLCVLPIDSTWRVLSRSFDFAVFFALGYVGAARLSRLTLVLPAPTSTFWTIVFFALSIALHRLLPSFSHPWWGGSSLLALGLVGTAGLWFLSIAISRNGLASRILGAVGQASLVIFILHPIAIGVARLAILPLLPDAPAILLTILITGVGIVFPFMVYRVIKALGWLTPLFMLPLPATAATGAKTQQRTLKSN